MSSLVVDGGFPHYALGSRPWVKSVPTVVEPERGRWRSRRELI
jgi:hypothetical protein